MLKKLLDFAKKHPSYNAGVHVSLGIGIGILIARPFVFHPVRVGILFIIIGVLGHLYPLFVKK